jgi:3-oxoacyl-[acyl-carrier protein] reductase
MSALLKARKGSKPVAIVSGGSRGLGAELVKGFLARGFRVATMSRSRTRFIEQLEAQSRKGTAFLWAAADATDAQALRQFVKTVVDRFGRVDVLVNNAGIAREGILATAPVQDISDIVDTNLTAAIFLSQACSRVMLRQASGCIVNISSVNAIRGQTGVSVYSATKAALDGLTRSLARELGPRNIRVNSVAPGYFESRMVEDMPEADRQRIARRTPLGRLARVQDIANAVHFLASEQAAFVTGQTLAVDGGLTC